MVYFIFGIFVGYALCRWQYKIAIKRWEFDCSPTRTNDWRKATQP